jgi:beta-fructofuranosidase
VFRLSSSWVWDFWLADDGKQFHLFFLKAPTAVGDPDRRHWSATVGHAVSDDLSDWSEVRDAVVPSDGPAFDDLAIWTGSVLRADDGLWWMFYTGVDRSGSGLVQRIGAATSTDLNEWARVGQCPMTEADPRWYETLSIDRWTDQAWRDPWVFRDPESGSWQMLVTARVPDGDPSAAGVVGQATSADLVNWRVGPPLSLSDAGFGQLEVMQVAEVDGRWVLLFQCMTAQLSDERRARGERGGIWAVNIDKAAGPYDIAGAYLVHDESLYVGRLIRDRSGNWMMLAFHNVTPDGRFIGEISEPLPVNWAGDGRLRVG